MLSLIDLTPRPVPLRPTLALFAVLAVSMSVPNAHADAQRRPGVPMGFYTTTGLLTAEVEAASVASNNVFAEAPSFSGSLLVTGPIAKGAKRAWIAGVRGTALTLGNTGGCLITPGATECENRRFTERASLLTGGSFDIRSTVLRVMAGPTLYSVESAGTRVGTQIRLDYGSPRLRGPTPVLFLSYSMLGRQGGQAVGITTFGATLRWVRK